MKKYLYLIIFTAAFLLPACSINEPGAAQIPGYTLQPTGSKTYLPPLLFEISGITLIDSSSLACVEDENGMIYFYDFNLGEITDKKRFWGPGDYEGIASVNDTIYVLRSDGFLFEVRDYRSEEPEVDIIPTGLPRTDNEGLCFDKKRRMLLITCKEYSGKKSWSGKKRYIYGFDLHTKRLTDEPVYSLDMDDIIKCAGNDNPQLKQKYVKKGSKHKETIKFNPSDIAINPLTRKIYILSAVDHALAIFSKKGRIENFITLNPAVFNQPEGILFLKNGDMLISNEGGSGRPTILRFKFTGD
jgi:hypothetical protein